MKDKKNNIKYAIFIILFYLFIFQDILQKYIGGIKFLDEIYSALAIPIIIIDIFIKTKNNNFSIKKNNFLIFVGILICIFSGIISSIKNEYQNFIIAISDMFLVLKFFLAIYISKKIFKKEEINEYKKNIAKHCKIIITVFFILAIISYGVKIFPTDIRYGIKSVQLFYSHSTILVMNVMFVLAIYFWSSQTKIFNIYVIEALFIIASTLRIKALCMIVVILILYYYIIYKEKKVTINKSMILALIIFIIGYQQINFYFVEIEDSARASLLKTSFQIAEDYFPFGTGFGTYASYMSAENYSEVYYIYGLNNIFGLSEDFNSFMCDSFWPMIIGQFGIVGLIGYLIALLGIFKTIQKIYTYDKYNYFAAIILFIYMLISSTSESAFVHYMAIPIAMFLGTLFINSEGVTKNEKNSN